MEREFTKRALGRFRSDVIFHATLLLNIDIIAEMMIMTRSIKAMHFQNDTLNSKVWYTSKVEAKVS